MLWGCWLPGGGALNISPIDPSLSSSRQCRLKNLDTAQTPAQRTVIQCQIEATDRQIDQLVYELYELTDEEIKIIEAES